MGFPISVKLLLTGADTEIESGGELDDEGVKVRGVWENILSPLGRDPERGLCPLPEN